MKVAVMAMNLTTLIREFQYLNLAEEKIPLKLKRDGKDLSYLYDIYIYTFLAADVSADSKTINLRTNSQ